MMDKEKLIAGIVGGIVAGFAIGVGSMLAERTLGKHIKRKDNSETKGISEAVKEGVKEGVKQAKVEEDAAKYSEMVKSSKGGGNPRRAMANSGSRGYMGFDGNPPLPKSKDFSAHPQNMEFSGDPLKFGQSPNGELNNF